MKNYSILSIISFVLGSVFFVLLFSPWIAGFINCGSDSCGIIFMPIWLITIMFGSPFIFFAVILGILSLGRIKTHNLKGRKLAIMGIIFGILSIGQYVWLLLSIHQTGFNIVR